MSYRIRGSLPRAQTKINTKNRTNPVKATTEFPPKNSTTLSIDMKIMFMYSAMKIKAKGVALYSTLNPDTISDSPSAKSKGARLVSARQVINQTKHTGNRKRQIKYLYLDIVFNSRTSFILSTQSRIRAIETSYEIVWAIARSLPRRAYFELDDHPASRVE